MKGRTWFRLWVTLIGCQSVLAAESPGNGVPTQETVLRYFQTDERYSFRVRLLDAVMKETSAEYGPYRLEPTEIKVTQARGLQLLEVNAGIDIAFIASSQEREAHLLPIKDPILSGILGFRVNLIHQGQQENFRKIEQLQELKEHYVAGFGSQWADMAILLHNGLRVTGVANYENIFDMLQHERFHYFPRGINEAWGEVERKGHDYPSLRVEETLALYYPYPVYFFVSKKDVKLAERLAKGLTSVKAGPIYKTLFLQEHGEDIKRADLAHRKLFVLENPALESQKLPDGTFWWLDESILKQLP